MIFCIEDDDDIRELMLYTLRTAGFEAQGFPDSQSFWQALNKEQPQLILLDIMLPEEDGLSILKKLRSDKAGSHIPVIMATAKGTEYDKVKGLDLGADDYLVKPFGMMEMVSRIKAVLRRSGSGQKDEELVFGQLRLNPSNYTVTRNGARIDLTLKEFELLSTLMRHPSRVFTRQELLEKVWSDNFLIETRTVDVHIGTLRTKLGPCGEYIHTVRGVGYRMEEPHD
ncbi:response regulator transcription factor [Streptococcus caviae]|uniref:response regulator transcription factor n=1 Tax=Streptococcus sp. 'caviae' TaxID=1915004 RepID=UPI00094B9454|nr:response regulator transcription factor [Streptococcus sp. 'caviae']OLN82554.1 DNA-binding response regulator [Streptococcus sp. 'caviae']